MVKHLTVEWCPKCAGWKQAKRIVSEMHTGLLETGVPLDPVSLERLHKTHQCGHCDHTFVTVTPSRPAGVFQWHDAASRVTGRKEPEPFVEDKEAPPLEWVI